jgi:hypothetical protein
MGWLRAALEAAGLAERTRFLGFVPREAMPGVYRRADVLVHPSHFEGQSNTVLEAMASGLAVVASDIPGCAELVRPGESGARVPPGPARAGGGHGPPGPGTGRGPWLLGPHGPALCDPAGVGVGALTVECNLQFFWNTARDLPVALPRR